MNIKIKVTEKHLEKGERAAAFYCPIALALKDVVNDDTSAGVTYESIQFRLGIQTQTNKINTPKKVYDTMGRFDMGKDVKPFEFELDIPEMYLR